MLYTDVAVIGAGFSATALTIGLLDRLPPSRSIALVGPRRHPSRGVAYAVRSQVLRLNVPAGRMSLYPDRPDHFCDWLVANSHPYQADDFAPRVLYGDYLEDGLNGALQRTGNHAAISLIDAEAVSIETDGTGHVYRLSDGRRLQSRMSALCLGATPSGLPLLEEAVANAAWTSIIADPWQENWQETVPVDGTVVIAGSGLTMLDQVLLLEECGFRGRIHAISRRGLLPKAHRVPRATPLSPVIAPGQGELSSMLAVLRAQCSEAHDWRAVIDGLRPVTQALWAGLSETQKRRFLRHAASFWNVHRHRAAPEVAARISGLLASGRFVVHRGRLTGIDAGLVVRFATDSKDQAIHADRLVNCTGVDGCTLSRSAFLRSMADAGMVACGTAGMGIAVDETSAVVGAEGRCNRRLYAMGPMTVGRFFEITAVPDIRVQARAVASAIADGINGHGSFRQ